MVLPLIEPINPRDLILLPDGRQALSNLLQTRAGYVPQSKPLSALCNAILRGTPLLCEGVRGGGKTALGEALSEALGLKKFYLQCMSGLRIEDVLYSWDRTAQTLYVEQQVRLGVPLAQAQAEQWTMPFLSLGDVLAAYHYSAQPETECPCVLIIDEIDKLDEQGEDFLLQILARSFANIPRLLPDSRIGVLPETKAAKRRVLPIVILTSNNMRSGVSGPLRSRARYTSIKSPSMKESLKIMLARIPGLAVELLTDLAMLIKGIEGKSLKEKPALREYLELAETLVEKNVLRIDEAVLLDNIDTLAKSEKDIVSLEKAFESIYTEYIDSPDKDVLEAVSLAVSEIEAARSGAAAAAASAFSRTGNTNASSSVPLIASFPKYPKSPLYPRSSSVDGVVSPNK